MGVGKTYIAGGVYEEEKDTILYAKWGATEYELIYNANGGIVEKASKPIVYNEIYGSLPVPTREGYKFIGWYTENTGGTQITETMKYTIAGNQTIYAIWKKDGPLATTVIKATNYGDSVNYTANGITDWKVFLNDEGHVYIIAGDYVLNSRLNKASGISNGEGSYCVKGESRDILLNWLTTSSYWTAYANGISGATATGGPTLEQFVKSYNQKKGKNYSYNAAQNNNFIEGITDTLYNSHVESFGSGVAWNSCYGYWLLTSHTNNIKQVWHMSVNIRALRSWDYDYMNFSVRPLICLPSEITANKGSDGKWTFN